jgi:hypothetical protein
MKGLWGVLAGLTGITLLCLGFLGTIQGCMLSHSEPEYSNGIAGYGMMALLFGGLLCWVALKYTKHDDGEEEPNDPPVSSYGCERSPEEHLCPNCLCWLTDGSKTCKCCGADLK